MSLWMILHCSGVSNHSIYKDHRKECKIVTNNQILIILDLPEMIIFYSKQSFNHIADILIQGQNGGVQFDYDI